MVIQRRLVLEPSWNQRGPMLEAVRWHWPLLRFSTSSRTWSAGPHSKVLDKQGGGPSGPVALAQQFTAL